MIRSPLGIAFIGAFAVFSSVSDARAQFFGNPAGLAPDTPGAETANPAPNHANNQDRLFVRQATIGGHAEVELGKLASRRASTDAVKEFGERMVADHSKGNERLTSVARGLNPNAPKELDAEHQRIRTILNEKSGKDFDIAYLTAQIQDHQKTANLLVWHISYGQNDALKKYATEQLPIVLEHLEAAKQKFAEITTQ
jgi:putative membrane protein